MERVIIGVDPRKLSVTIEARDSREVLRATGRFETSTAGQRELLAAARQWPERVWAVEGANGIGRRWPSGCSPEGNGRWMCPRRGCPVPARDARPMPRMPMPSSWSRCATRDCGSWPPMRT